MKLFPHKIPTISAGRLVHLRQFPDLERRLPELSWQCLWCTTSRKGCLQSTKTGKESGNEARKNFGWSHSFALDQGSRSGKTTIWIPAWREWLYFYGVDVSSIPICNAEVFILVPSIHSPSIRLLDAFTHLAYGSELVFNPGLPCLHFTSSSILVL